MYIAAVGNTTGNQLKNELMVQSSDYSLATLWILTRCERHWLKISPDTHVLLMPMCHFRPLQDPLGFYDDRILLVDTVGQREDSPNKLGHGHLCQQACQPHKEDFKLGYWRMETSARRQCPRCTSREVAVDGERAHAGRGSSRGCPCLPERAACLECWHTDRPTPGGTTAGGRSGTAGASWSKQGQT